MFWLRVNEMFVLSGIFTRHTQLRVVFGVKEVCGDCFVSLWCGWLIMMCDAYEWEFIVCKYIELIG